MTQPLFSNNHILLLHQNRDIIKTVEAEMTKALRTLRNEIDNYILTK